MSWILTRAQRFEETIKKSRFAALAAPVDTPAEALDVIAAHSVTTATHNCWAYRIGQHYRFHDDGEPAGTAGRPILQAMDGQDCDRVVVLVVRWFGGVKLGAGGLMRAYGGAAAQCLRQADKAPWIAHLQLACRCDFADVARVQSRLPAFNATVVQETFDARGVHWHVSLPQTQAQAFMQAFTDWTRGQGSINPVQ